MIGKIILGCIGLYITGGIIEAWNLACISVRKKMDSYTNPKKLSVEYAGMILNVLSVKSSKILIAVWEESGATIPKESVWFEKESIPSEWRNVGAWFAVKSDAGDTVSFEKYLVYKNTNSPQLDGYLC